MTMVELSIDPGLLARFRKAGGEVRWRAVPPRTPRRAKEVQSVRMAHLHDEEARVETRETDDEFELTVDSGPLGALLLVVEASNRGPPQELSQRESSPAFRSGLLRAVWGSSDRPVKHAVPFADIVALARYALA
jgi:hypothetical protein